MKFWNDLKEALRSGDDVDIEINLKWEHIILVLLLTWLMILLWK